CALTRILLAARCTVPSSKCATPSCCPISRRLRASPLLYCITLVRLMTFRSAIWARSLRIWSCTPSAKCSFCFSSPQVFKRQHRNRFCVNDRPRLVRRGAGHKRRLAAGCDHELVERKIAKRQEQHHDDHAVHPSSSLRSDRLLARHIFLALQALRRYLENPAKDHRGYKPKRENNDQAAQRP